MKRLRAEDQSRVLKEERDELKKRLSGLAEAAIESFAQGMKDQEVAQHVDRRVVIYPIGLKAYLKIFKGPRSWVKGRWRKC